MASQKSSVHGDSDTDTLVISAAHASTKSAELTEAGLSLNSVWMRGFIPWSTNSEHQPRTILDFDAKHSGLLKTSGSVAEQLSWLLSIRDSETEEAKLEAIEQVVNDLNLTIRARKLEYEILAAVHGEQTTFTVTSAHKILLDKLLAIIQRKAEKFEYVERRPASLTSGDKAEITNNLALKLGVLVNTALEDRELSDSLSDEGWIEFFGSIYGRAIFRWPLSAEECRKLGLVVEPL